MSAHDATQTHYCKFPGCENEASSRYGRYAYCAEHRGLSPKKEKAGDTLAAKIAGLASLARQADRQYAKAERMGEQAAEATRKAREIQSELQRRMREIGA